MLDFYIDMSDLNGMSNNYSRVGEEWQGEGEGYHRSLTGELRSRQLKLWHRVTQQHNLRAATRYLHCEHTIHPLLQLSRNRGLGVGCDPGQGVTLLGAARGEGGSQNALAVPPPVLPNALEN